MPRLLKSAVVRRSPRNPAEAHRMRRRLRRLKSIAPQQTAVLAVGLVQIRLMSQQSELVTPRKN